MVISSSAVHNAVPAAPSGPVSISVPSDKIHLGIKETLRSVLADRYVILVDCQYEGDLPPADVLQRLPHDLRVVIDRAAVADAKIPADTLVIVHGSEASFGSIRSALAGTVRTTGFVQENGNPAVFVDVDDARHLIKQNPHSAATFVNFALRIAKEYGKGAEVVSYDGPFTQSATDDGYGATFPLREWSAQPSMLERATSGLRSMADVLRRSLTLTANERRTAT
ncbi:hypothetical protein ACPWR0_17900 [Pandoraea pneumonica]|uniref:hypothetical protein n=1 Tax=Pandoraea pneumonica TaxID=2508299 RepID=UPI003CF9F8DC